MSPPLAVFHPEYAPAGYPHFQRLAIVAAHAQAEGLAQLRQPQRAGWSDLEGLHDAAYLAAYRDGIEPLASSCGLMWSPKLAEGTLRMLGGQSLAAELAFAHGLCFNIACGFHHALPMRGAGFCALNGLAWLAHRFPAKRIAVLDCDEHGGDGTEAFCARLPNLSQVTIFGSRFGARGGVRSLAVRVPPESARDSEQIYLDAVEDGIAHLLRGEPDLVVFQAGMDAHRDDPKSSLRLSTETLSRRDALVLRSFARCGVPLVVVLAGAYQAPADIAALYANTLRHARRAWAA